MEFIIAVDLDDKQIRYDKPSNCSCPCEDMWAMKLSLLLMNKVDSGTLKNYYYYKNGELNMDYNKFKKETLEEFKR